MKATVVESSRMAPKTKQGGGPLGLRLVDFPTAMGLRSIQGRGGAAAARQRHVFLDDGVIVIHKDLLVIFIFLRVCPVRILD